MPRVLVVANQTVASPDLLKAVKDRIARGPCQFTLLVPATRKAHLSNTELLGHLGTSLLPKPEDAASEDEFESARRKLEYGLEQLHGLGAEIEGRVGDSSPLKAIQDELERRPHDEIILSTLPSGISRWLAQDLPHKARRFKLPVTVVSAAKPG